MRLNLADDERSRLGAANIDALFSHVISSMDTLGVVHQIPDGAVVTFQTGDQWVDEQNNLLGAQVLAEEKGVYHVSISLPPSTDKGISIIHPDGRQVTFHTGYIFTEAEACRLTRLPQSRVRSLDQQGVVVPSSRGKRGKMYSFAELIQLQAYQRIAENREYKVKDIRARVLKRILSFYKEQCHKVGVYHYHPVLVSSEILIFDRLATQFFDLQLNSVAPRGNVSILVKKAFDNWTNRQSASIQVYPSLNEVLIQLSDNALNAPVDIQDRLLMAA